MAPINIFCLVYQLNLTPTLLILIVKHDWHPAVYGDVEWQLVLHCLTYFNSDPIQGNLLTSLFPHHPLKLCNVHPEKGSCWTWKLSVKRYRYIYLQSSKCITHPCPWILCRDYVTFFFSFLLPYLSWSTSSNLNNSILIHPDSTIAQLKDNAFISHFITDKLVSYK